MRTICGASILLLAGATAAAQTTSGWQLVWSDEFNGAAGTAPDPAKWNFDLGGGCWGNAEAEVYTNSISNAFQDGNGNLVIRALKDDQGRYTSARLKLPFGKGVWPAFWMLGENISTSPWPACGEVDIMENFGIYQDKAGIHDNTSINNGTAHGPG